MMCTGTNNLSPQTSAVI